MRDEISARDAVRMALAVVFGTGVTGFLKAAGVLEGLAKELGGSMPAAYIVLLAVTGFILIMGF